MTNERKRITMERVYQADIRDVWDLWTTKEGIESWWGPGGFTVKVRKLELRPGGQLLYAMTAIDPPQVAFMKKAGMPLTTEAQITFTEVVPLRAPRLRAPRRFHSRRRAVRRRHRRRAARNVRRCPHGAHVRRDAQRGVDCARHDGLGERDRQADGAPGRPSSRGAAMTAPGASRGVGRSVLAVFAGFVTTALLSVAADAVMHATGIFPPTGQPMSDGLYVWATVYRCAFTVLGGYVTAALAPRNPLSHVGVLGTIGMAAATAGAVATWDAGPAFGPRWYPIMLVVTALPCVWSGGLLRGRLRPTREAKWTRTWPRTGTPQARGTARCFSADEPGRPFYRQVDAGDAQSSRRHRSLVVTRWFGVEIVAVPTHVLFSAPEFAAFYWRDPDLIASNSSSRFHAEPHELTAPLKRGAAILRRPGCRGAGRSGSRWNRMTCGSLKRVRPV